MFYLDTKNSQAKYKMLLHSLNIKSMDPPRVIFMQLDLKKPGPPVLFDAELKNTKNGTFRIEFKSS